MDQKIIYMTYNKPVPEFVFSRWLELNKNYSIQLSFDKDCLEFLKTHFNEDCVKMFNNMNEGKYKADFWRICKLYVHGGVYSDVDLVPHLDIDSLDEDVTFYSCLTCNKAIFQAFMLASKPKNPLLLSFIMSFFINNLHIGGTFPTSDMYECIKYNLNGIDFFPEKKYTINEIKIPINVGTSDSCVKIVDLHYFPHDVEYEIRLQQIPNNSIFHFVIENNKLIVSRLDNDNGWENNLYADICIQSNEVIYMFKENMGENNNWVTSYVTDNGIKMLDSRDLTYHNNRGW